MLEAAKAGDSEQVQRLLTAYPQIVNCRDLDGRLVPVTCVARNSCNLSNLGKILMVS